MVWKSMPFVDCSILKAALFFSLAVVEILRTFEQAEKSPNRDLIVEAMIQNLRLQAELLSRQLMISNQINNNNEKKSTNETRI